MQRRINVLRASGRPMRALDIARAIGLGCEKRDVNRVVHHEGSGEEQLGNEPTLVSRASPSYPKRVGGAGSRD